MYFFGLFACATDPGTRADSAVELIRQGKQLEQDGYYLRAKTKYQLVLEDYPDSKERAVAQLYVADALFKGSEYAEAKFNYQKFIEQNPVHRWADHAHYYKAMSDFKLIDLASRDQTSTHSSLENFEDFIKRFPKSPYLKHAVEKKEECVHMIAENYFIISKFYFQSGSYQSAINRLKYLLEKYPDQKFMDEATFLLAESLLKEQSYDQAAYSYKELVKKYPGSRFSLKAKKQLRRLRR